MSIIKANSHQIGQSLTATNNFSWYQPSSPDGTVRLGVGNAGATTLDTITVNSSGNVGIGTTSPAVPLQVAGEIRIYPTSGTGNLRFGSGGVEKGKLLVDSSSNMGFETAGTQRMTLDSSGNLGLGVTPSAWIGLKAFQINAQASLAADSTSTQLSSNAYYGSGGWKYIGTGYAANYYQDSGQHVWRTAASGSAGGTISFTQAMTLNASGSLLVGGTSTSGLAPAEKSIILENNQSVAAEWYARSIVRNVTADKAVFLGVYNTYPGVFAHLGNLNGWNDLYVNNVAGGGGGNVYVNLGTGTVYTSSGRLTNTNPSDERLKEDISPISYGLAEINKLNPVTFKFKNDYEDKKRLSWGFIAQEVQPIMPELVTTFTQYDEEYLGLETNGIYTILVKAIQELSAQVTTLQAEINELKA